MTAKNFKIKGQTDFFAFILYSPLLASPLLRFLPQQVQRLLMLAHQSAWVPLWS